MKASLEIEIFGDDVDQELRGLRRFTNSLIDGLGDFTFGREPAQQYFVAEITGFDKTYGYHRIFLKGKKDYSRANRIGSRGVYKYYLLESGKIYDVRKQISWRRCERFFCVITNEGEIEKVCKGYVDKWINERLELPF